MDDIINSANSNAKFKEATEKLINEVNNISCGHCFHPHPLLSWCHNNLHYQFYQSIRNKIFEFWKIRDKAQVKIKPKEPTPAKTPKPKTTKITQRRRQYHTLISFHCKDQTDLMKLFVGDEKQTKWHE